MTAIVVGREAAHTPSLLSVFSSMPLATTRGGAHWDVEISMEGVMGGEGNM